MKPREFCREWFSATPEEALEKEAERGYRERCVELLSDITGVGVEAVDKWGKGKDGGGLEFAKMPPQYKKTLAYAMTLKRIAEVAYKGDPKILEFVLEQLRPRKTEQ